MTAPHVEIVEGGFALVTETGQTSTFLDRDQVALLVCSAARSLPVNAATGVSIAQQESVGGVTVRFAGGREALDFIIDASQWLKRQLGGDPRPLWKGQD